MVQQLKISSQEIEKNEKIMVINIEGNLDYVTAPQFITFFKDNTKDLKNIIVNCDKLDYVDSTGLATLINQYSKAKSDERVFKVVIRSITLVYETMDVSGVLNIFKPYENINDAVQSFTAEKQ